MKISVTLTCFFEGEFREKSFLIYTWMPNIAKIYASSYYILPHRTHNTLLNIPVFWDVVPRILVEKYLPF